MAHFGPILSGNWMSRGISSLESGLSLTAPGLHGAGRESQQREEEK